MYYRCTIAPQPRGNAPRRDVPHHQVRTFQIIYSPLLGVRSQPLTGLGAAFSFFSPWALEIHDDTLRHNNRDKDRFHIRYLYGRRYSVHT